MAKLHASRTVEYLNHRGMARNSLAPSADLYNAIGAAHNHILAHRRKTFGSFAFSYNDPLVSPGNNLQQFRWYGETGKGVSHIRCTVGLAKGTSTTQYGYWTVRNEDTATNTDGDLLQTAPAASALSSLEDIRIFSQRFAVSELTTYSGYYTIYSQVPVFAVVHEEAPLTYDTESTSYLEQSIGAGTDITDAQREGAVDACFDLWKYNSAVQIAWAKEDTGVLMAIGATDTNVISLTTTAPSDITQGWRIDLTGKNTKNRTTVPMLFAANVRAGSYSGSSAVKLKDSGGTLATLVPSADGWVSGTVDLATSVTKVDIHGANVEVMAVHLSQWEA